ncbi:prohibitin family protein [Desulfopila sp. IMCC35008]|uniref:prohibitin family protein n=1 Tax=Desulfopila sp. IMCC35008 TaxID=2653858 RepID=UPI0013D4BBBD|nr:prohibitin family protein [Desulfopila sp. IMCC35008]
MQKMLNILKNHSAKLITILLIILFVVIYYLDAIFITIYPGHAGVLFHRFFNRGTVTDHSYGEGVNAIFPWDKMFIYDIRSQNIIQEIKVLSQNGLTIKVQVAIRFRPDTHALPYLHQKVGPNYPTKIIIPSTISAVREVIGKYTPEQIYTTKRDIIQDEILVETIEETGRLPIIYNTIIVQSIKLPEEINNAIETKLRQEQEFLAYTFRIQKETAEKERKKIEAEGIKIFQNTVAESLSENLLRWKGIEAARKLAQSNNTKIVVFGGTGQGGVPIFLNSPETTAGTDKTTSPGLNSQEAIKTLPAQEVSEPAMPTPSHRTLPERSSIITSAP